MPKTIEIIADICEELNGNGFVSKPRIVDLNAFDFEKHKAQESSIDGVGTEFVFQYSDGPSDDNYAGTIGYPIDGKMFVFDYAT
jgi:hypothetical protein